ncbi:V/A-type H+-transporting ATPase subunit E [Methanophagales archaeon]|nr:V/A-type H+-transporting ATPase subunit E [Methanophagales archaeon]
MIQLGVNEIEGRIKDEANAECDKIVHEADAKASEQIREAREEIEARKRNFILAEEANGLEEKERMVRAARLNARKLKWNAEEEMTKKALEEAMKMINAVKEEGFKGVSYSDILAGLIKDASKSLIAGGSTDNELEALISGDDVSYIDKAILKKVSTELRDDMKVPVKLSLSSERLKSAGGVIVRGKDGKIEVNNTFEQRMTRYSASIREDIMKTLFTEK